MRSQLTAEMTESNKKKSRKRDAIFSNFYAMFPANQTFYIFFYENA